MIKLHLVLNKSRFLLTKSCTWDLEVARNIRQFISPARVSCTKLANKWLDGNLQTRDTRPPIGTKVMFCMGSSSNSLLTGLHRACDCSAYVCENLW